MVLILLLPYTIYIATIGSQFSTRQTTKEYPIIFSGYSCQGSEAKLSSCGSGHSVLIQYCATDNVIKLNCESKVALNTY